MSKYTAREVADDLKVPYTIDHDFENVVLTDEYGVKLYVGDEYDKGRHIGFSWCYNDGPSQWGEDGSNLSSELRKVMQIHVRR